MKTYSYTSESVPFWRESCDKRPMAFLKTSDLTHAKEVIGRNNHSIKISGIIVQPFTAELLSIHGLLIRL